MAKTVEQLTKEIYNECITDGEPISMDEAREMAEMEIKARGVKNYVRGNAPKAETAPKKKKTVKISDEKKSIFETILQNLDRNEYISKENITVIKENKLILVDLGDKKFKIDLIQQRNPKK